MVIKRKLRNSSSNTSVPVPEVKPEEITTPSPTPLKVERRGRPRKPDNGEEIINEKPLKVSRTIENFKIITFNPKGTSSGKGKEKETTCSPTELSSEPAYNEPIPQYDSNFVEAPEGNILQNPKNARPRKWIRRKVVIKTTGAEIAVPVWYSIQVSLFAIRNVSKPIQMCFPREALCSSSLSNQIHLNNFNQLTSQVIIFQKNEIWDESNILERLYYKNKNQHQRSIYFRKIVEIRRILKRIKEMEINELMSGFIGNFYSTKIGKTQNTWDQVPSQEMVVFVMNRLICVALLMNKALDTFIDAFDTFNALLRQTEFMSFALTCLAILARLNILTRVLLEEIKKCYGLLRNWFESFPRSSTSQTDFDNEINKLPECL
ncbi:9477_t:CDS:2 [Funneliformis geosporum]|uniref:13159_t:CDS:1 n=1 Tax=Funneliformis geosporum TaxID=1117311 RepID=A0A9W4SGA7_9GLOM|nr:13159_t:CDS:2 [Funneliformis geosporum]CAI2168241.1 9477_t:CDS:2 [Funneliformis geosporum]